MLWMAMVIITELYLMESQNATYSDRKDILKKAEGWYGQIV